jgi:hypothetical protein
MIGAMKTKWPSTKNWPPRRRTHTIWGMNHAIALIAGDGIVPEVT